MAEKANKQFTSSNRRASSKHKVAHSLGQVNQLTVPTPPPIIDDRNAWKTYWKNLSQPWRTEPEIDDGRQEYLAYRRAILPNVENGIYPFKKVKLSRADIEWLLATHENGQGPLDWSDKSQRRREGLDLRGAILIEVNLSVLPLTAMHGSLSWEEWVNATSEQREAAVIYLSGADLHFTHLERANLRGAHLEEAILYGVHLEGAILKETFFDRTTQLGRIVLGNKESGSASLADIHWGGVNIAHVNWSSIHILGDERLTYWPYWQKKRDKMPESKENQLDEYRRAFRANRQLAVLLQAEGISEEAERFAYRAQWIQRKILWREGIHSLRQYLFSLFLDLLAGYGYKPGRSFIAYLLVISLFAVIYYHLGHHFTWNEVIVISMTAFHGRGFFPDQFHPGDPQALVAAFEALVGLIIEVTFIATLTQRFFRK